jgi:hypothetical protein
VFEEAGEGVNQGQEHQEQPIATNTEEKKVLVVVLANTVVDPELVSALRVLSSSKPRTVMIHIDNAALARGAVVRANRADLPTALAIGHRLAKRDPCDAIPPLIIGPILDGILIRKTLRCSAPDILTQIEATNIQDR